MWDEANCGKINISIEKLESFEELMHKFKALLLACALLLLPASALADTPVTLSNGDFNQIGIADGLPLDWYAEAWITGEDAYRIQRLTDENGAPCVQIAAPEENDVRLCQTIPATIMMLYSPTILHDMTGSDDAILQMLLLYGFFLAGVLPSGSPYLANRPKLVLATTFVTMALGLLGVLFFAKTSLLLTNISFILFAVSYGLQAPLDFIYPNQLFATQVRGSLVGAVTAISRIGATGAAFIFPVLEPYFELSALFGAGLFVLALGFMIAVKFAPADRVFHQNC